jgi:ureidoacrylate peracid hydrolase
MSLKDWITPARTALLLVDMQVDFACADGALGKAGTNMTTAQAAVKQAEILAAAARAAKVPLVFVRLLTRTQTPFEQEWKSRRGDHSPPLCVEGSRGAAFAGPQPGSGDYVVSKSRYSPFTNTRLDESLRAMQRDTLVICGLTTECCIDAAAQGAFERDYHVVIASDAVAAYEPGLHATALKALALNAAQLATTGEIAAAWALGKAV